MPPPYFTTAGFWGIYRKRHPAIRSSVYSAGEQSPVFTIGALSFGIMICNNSNFPALAADMVARSDRRHLRAEQQQPAAGARRRGGSEPGRRYRPRAATTP